MSDFEDCWIGAYGFRILGFLDLGLRVVGFLI